MAEKPDSVAKNFIAKVNKKYPLKKAILFGSRSKGTNLKHSDYDFILVSNKFKNTFFTKRSAEMYDFWDSPYNLEALCYTPEEFKRKSNQIGIVQTAIKEGIKLL
jgi:predicted nucleotidyltransferase